jgi:hypothetical protein
MDEVEEELSKSLLNTIRILDEQIRQISKHKNKSNELRQLISEKRQNISLYLTLKGHTEKIGGMEFLPFLFLMLIPRLAPKTRLLSIRLLIEQFGLSVQDLELLVEELTQIIKEKKNL